MIVFSAIQAVTLLLLTLCGWLLPTLASPTRPFDVPVPDDPSARALTGAARRRYRALVVTGGAAIAAVTLSATWHATVITIGAATAAAIAVLFLSGWLALCHARATLLRATADLPRTPPAAAMAGDPPGRDGFPARWTFAVVVLLALTVTIGAARYHNLPAALPTRWTGGLADRHAPTTPDTAFSLVPAQILLTLMVLTVIGFGWPTGTPGTRAVARRNTRALLALCAGVQVCLLAGSLILWGLLPAPPA
jgi:uncharacterized membrane protein